MIPFRGRGLFVYSDPGGAKPVLSIAAQYRQKNEILIISDRDYSFVNNFGLKVRLINMAIDDIFKEFKPDFVFTGTSYTSDIEKKVIQVANNQNITSYAFIDHWTSFRNRFTDEFNNIQVPSQILVIDERAKTLAKKESLPESKLVVFGNPYHEYLSKWKPKLKKEKFLSSLNLEVNENYILAAPDPITNTKEPEKWGINEIEFLKRLSDAVRKKEKGWKIVIKLHPNQDLDKISDININNKRLILLDDTTQKVDLNTLIYYSECVIGFFSNILLEAEIMKRPIIRLITNEVNDPLKGYLKNDNIVKSYQELFLKIL